MKEGEGEEQSIEQFELLKKLRSFDWGEGKFVLLPSAISFDKLYDVNLDFSFHPR